MSTHDIHQILARVEEKERAGLSRSFLAPVCDSRDISVSIEGVHYTLTIRRHRHFTGWGIFQPEILTGRPSMCRLIDKAPDRTIIDRYLGLLPRVRLILIQEQEGIWYGISASNSDRVSLSGPVPVWFVERSSRFDTVYARFDGSRFLFDKPDRRRLLAHRLLFNLADNTHPDKLYIPGAVPQEKLAYKAAWIAKNNVMPVQREALTEEQRVAAALEHSGVKVQSIRVISDSSSSVVFNLDGQFYNVTYDRKSLQVASSGICLSGKDSDFDLTSLPSVFREKHNDRNDDWED